MHVTTLQSRVLEVQKSRLGLGTFRAMTRSCSVQASVDQRCFRVGIVSDVQYADIKDGHSFLGVPRYYRASLEGLRRAVSGWQAQKVDFGIQFGDLIDGFHPKDQSETAMKSVLDEFALLQKPVYHMIGNHCLYNLSRQRLNEVLGIQGVSSYYSFSPHTAWRFVVLDGYDVSMLGWPEGHPLHAQAKAILDERNVNEVSLGFIRIPGRSAAWCFFSFQCSSMQASKHSADTVSICHVAWQSCSLSMLRDTPVLLVQTLSLHYSIQAVTVRLPIAVLHAVSMYLADHSELGRRCCSHGVIIMTGFACRIKTTQKVMRALLADLCSLAAASVLISWTG